MTWENLLEYLKKVDEKDLSNSAYRASDDLPTIMSMPTNMGEWKASLAIAFEFGLMYVNWCESKTRCDEI